MDEAVEYPPKDEIAIAERRVEFVENEKRLDVELLFKSPCVSEDFESTPLRFIFSLVKKVFLFSINFQGSPCKRTYVW